MDAICDDLEAEHAALDAVLENLSEAQWLADTPAEGWTIKDQISHLAYFDETGTAAAVDPDRFRAEAAALVKNPRGVDVAVDIGRAKLGTDVLEWWRTARATMLAGFRQLDPKARLPWYGPDMGARSFATARLMETWAHGQDIIDTLGVERAATDRLRHVAHIGVGARRFAYLVNSLELPDEGVYVELESPSGETWAWGDPEWADSIKGEALDWCLLVTQRRHLDDTTLVVTGDKAAEWASIAQAFAGAAGGGRQPLGS